jgi:hypothetical protein
MHLKKTIVEKCDLSEAFSDVEQLDNMYLYEMFERDLAVEVKIQMAEVLRSEIEDYLGLEVWFARASRPVLCA